MSTYTTPSGWGVVKPRLDLRLPSGAFVQIEPLELTELLQLGIIDSIDSFSQKLLPAVQGQASQLSEEELSKNVLKDASQLGGVLEVVNKVVSRAIVQPQVHVLAEDAVPEQGKLYAHLIPLEDRMAVFEAVLPDMSDTFPAGGGPADGVANVADGEVVQHEAEQPSGAHRLN